MMRLRVFIISFLAMLGMMVSVLPATAFAANCSNRSGALLGLPTWYHYLTVTTDSSGGCSIELPKNGDQTDWGQTLGRIGLAVVEILLRLAAIISVGFVIYGGYRYILSQGEPDAIKRAQGTILNAVIGLVITIFATAIVGFVGGALF